MLKCIAKQSNSDICSHPFEKAKKKKEHKLEEIFDKGSKNKNSNLKKINKAIKRKIKDNKIKSVKKKSI
jgi:hypothetical protein